MTRGRQTFVVAIFLIVATVLQGRFAHAISIKGGQPDFTLIVLACGASLIGGANTVWLGLWAGLLETSMIGVYIGSYLTSRVLAGAFAGGLHRDVIRDNILVPPMVAVATTAIAELIFAGMAPSIWIHHLHRWGGSVAGKLLYNALLSYPIYYLLRRCGIGRKQEDAYGK